MMMLLFRNTRTTFTFTLTTSFLCVSGVGVGDSFKVAPKNNVICDDRRVKQILISDTPLRTRLAPFDTFRIDSIDSPCMPRIYSSFQGISLLSLSERLTCNRSLSRLPSNTFPGLDFLFYTPSTPRFGSSISFASACAKRTRRSTSERSHFLLLTWAYLSLCY